MKKSVISKRNIIKAAAFLVAFLVLVPAARGQSDGMGVFMYMFGTERIPQGCGGQLKVTETKLVYQCEQLSVTIPYHAIKQMEFRPRVSKQIRKMKLAWVTKPTSIRSKHAGFFSVLYTHKGRTHAIIMKVSDNTLRPYMAEIDLKTGRSIESGGY